MLPMMRERCHGSRLLTLAFTHHLFHQPPPQPLLQVPAPDTDAEADVPRSASATSSLDPYYFGVRTPSDSPIPPVPSLPKTPDMHPYEPVTPGRDPAAIDRRMLVGVGELATPRWARGPRNDNDDLEFVVQERVDEEDSAEMDMPEDERDLSDSPWTIEAIDGEQDEETEVRRFSSLSASSSERPSSN